MLVKRHRDRKPYLLTATLIAVVGVFLAYGLFVILRSQAATVANIAVPASRAAVPVPTSGFYWGGTNIADAAGYGCTQGDRYLELECKVTAIGNATPSLAGTFPKAADGLFHTAQTREYLPGSYGCRDSQNQLKPGGGMYQTALQGVKAGGRRTMIISTKCGDWAKLANGGGTATEDTYIKQLTTLLDNFPVPVIFVFHHEPENDACTTGGFGTPDEFRAAFRQFSADVRSQEAADGKRNISIGSILMNDTFRQNNRANVFTSCANLTPAGAKTAATREIRNPENWWPGDDAIDWVGVDAYNFNTVSYPNLLKPVSQWTTGACPTTAQRPTSNYGCTAARATKPIVVGELGVGLGTGIPTQADKAAFFNQVQTTALDYATYPWLKPIKSVAYWSGGAQNLIDPADGSTGHPSLVAFAKLTLDKRVYTPVFATGGTGGGTTGDLNGDGIVDSGDLSALLSALVNRTSAGDLNGDGTTTVADLSILLVHWSR